MATYRMTVGMTVVDVEKRLRSRWVTWKLPNPGGFSALTDSGNVRRVRFKKKEKTTFSMVTSDEWTPYTLIVFALGSPVAEWCLETIAIKPTRKTVLDLATHCGILSVSVAYLCVWPPSRCHRRSSKQKWSSLVSSIYGYGFVPTLYLK